MPRWYAPGGGSYAPAYLAKYCYIFKTQNAG
jgi:hypothetical protein